MSTAIKENHLTVVLGMHRSGTSAITSGLKVFGAGFGSNLQPAMPGVNEKGFFEDNDIVSINEEILRFLSVEWHTLSPITDRQLLDPTFAQLKADAINLIKEKTQSEGFLAIKDPRMARLLPFWQQVFDEAKLDVSYVIAIRNPLSVAKSLEKRDQIGKEKSYYLWLQHLLPSMRYTTNKRRVVVDYDCIITQPRAELTRISNALGYNGVIDHQELTKYENEFLDPNLRHASCDMNDLAIDEAAPHSLIEVYRIMRKVATDEIEIDSDEVLEICKSSETQLSEFAPAFRYITRQDWKIAELQQVLSRQNDQCDMLNGEISSAQENILKLKQELQQQQKSIETRDIKISSLNSRISTLNTQTFDLNTQITTLNSQITVFNTQTSALNMQISALQQQETELREVINHIKTSTSWQITAPLRNASRWRVRFLQLPKIYKNYRKKHPGITGLRRLIGRSIESLRKGGITTLRKNITLHVLSDSIATTPTILPTMTLDDISPDSAKLPKDIAVHAHIYYVDLAPEICSYLANIPVRFSLYITTDTEEKSRELKDAFHECLNIESMDIRVVENRGRDIAPMIVALGKELSRHELVLHIHTKRSPHNPELRGWRRYLMNALLGSRQSVAAILSQFEQDKKLGILYPQIYRPVIPFMRIGGNASFMKLLLSRAGKENVEIDNLDQANFPAGGMFWFRGKAIEPIVDLGLVLNDFCPESGQDDATIAHAIERLFPYFSEINGLRAHSYIPRKLYSEHQGAAPIDLMHECLASYPLENPTIIFDHNIGGGTNRYSRNLITDSIKQGKSVLRVYCTQGVWVVEWVTLDDGLIFASSNDSLLFKALQKVKSHEIIINSLYGYPCADKALEKIIELADTLKANLDVKIHDFYAVCPSQHLLDQHERYCGVPSDHNSCITCLKNNPAVHWASTRLISISEWRAPFANMFAKASTISAFDPSSVDILNKAFDLSTRKINITPHTDDYFEACEEVPLTCNKLNIGVLGTLTTIKGAAVVNSLAEYLGESNEKATITVIGASFTPVHQDVRVLGPYDNKKLSEIISKNEINVFLMPTIVPETFSYTISEAMKMRLPIVAFDLGAQGNRVGNYELGAVIPLESSPEKIYRTALSVLERAKEIK